MNLQEDGSIIQSTATLSPANEMVATLMGTGSELNFEKDKQEYIMLKLNYKKQMETD